MIVTFRISRENDRMANQRSETIYALSSGGVPAGVAVIRLSGPLAKPTLKRLAGIVPPDRQAVLRLLRDPDDGTVLDQALVLAFTGPHSFTGEDCVEFHCHGGRAVVSAVLVALGRLDGLKAAEPGAFTRQAFENNKMDLTSVEGLSDLLHAETESQRRQAFSHMQGHLAALYEEWRDLLIRSRAFIEAELDFADEDDVPDSMLTRVEANIRELHHALAKHLAESRRGERIRDGLTIVLLGKPNAGKSSLLNALAQRDVAIVTPEAGTTRDLIEVRLDLDGYAVTLIDTAGLRETDGLVEREGIRRAEARSGDADLILWLHDVTEDRVPLPVSIADLDCPKWLIGTKTDLAPSVVLNDERMLAESSDTFDQYLHVSHEIADAKDSGLAELVTALTGFADEMMADTGTMVFSRMRHRAALERSLRDVAAALEDKELELRAEDLRSAAHQLSTLTGRMDVEDLLDVIFRDFCIGK